MRPDGRLRLPGRVEEAIGRRLVALSESCLEPLRVAAVIGEEFSALVVAAAGDLPEESLQALLEEAEEAGMVVRAPALGGWRFSHGLVRRTLYSTLPPERRSVLHRRVGLAMERLGDTPAWSSELVYHFSLGSPDDPERVAVHAERAARQAMASLAFEEAARLYEVALAAAARADRTGPRRRARLSAALEDARARWGESPTRPSSSTSRARDDRRPAGQGTIRNDD